MRIGLLGHGEIGKAVRTVYTVRAQLLGTEPNFCFLIKDLDRDDGLTGLDVLHVVIPFSDNFVSIVEKEIIDSAAKMTIIHSTVAVGTTSKIQDFLLGSEIVHSPCRGVHPKLYEGLMTFPKFVGGRHASAVHSAVEHMRSLGINAVECKNAETTELAKLLDTAYYGVCIAFHGEAARACEKFGADFHDVMTAFNSSYNDGYKKLGRTDVVRPVLTPPGSEIGGHCVVQNAELLKTQFDSTALELILEYKKKSRQ